MTKRDENKLRSQIRHITGECMCSPNSKTCVYWKNVDSNKKEWQTDEIIKLIKKYLTRGI